jgi:hypothetical protein
LLIFKIIPEERNKGTKEQRNKGRKEERNKVRKEETQLNTMQ